MDSTFKNPFANDKNKKSFAGSFVSDNSNADPNKFSFAVRPSTVLGLVQDCGKLFKSRMDMMKHNIVTLVKKPQDGLDNRKTKKPQYSGAAILPVSKQMYFCSVEGCEEACESEEELNEHLASSHMEFTQAPESSSHMEVEQEAQEEQQSPTLVQEEKEDMDEMLKLAIVENHLLKERLKQNQQTALLYQQYLAQCQKAQQNH